MHNFLYAAYSYQIDEHDMFFRYKEGKKKTS